MSGTAKRKSRPAADADKTISSIALARSMGADSWDPIPPDAYKCYMDPAIQLTQRARRLHAWELSRTIGSKIGGRTPACKDHRGWLGLVQARDDLAISLAHLSEAQSELEHYGLSRRDEDGHIYPCGKIAYKKRRKKGEGEEKAVPCTELIPKPVLLYFQSLDKKRSSQCVADYLELLEWGQRVEAEAIGAARDAKQTAIDEYLRHVGYAAEEETRGAPRKSREAVQLELLELPQLSVDFSFCTKFGGILNKNPTPSVHNGSTLLHSQSSYSETLTECSQSSENVENRSKFPLNDHKVAAKITPRYGELTQNLPEESLNAADDLVSRVVAGLTGEELAEDERTKFSELATTLKVPESIVCDFLRREFRTGHTNSSALYARANGWLPLWISQHPGEVELAMQRELAQHSRGLQHARAARAAAQRPEHE